MADGRGAGTDEVLRGCCMEVLAHGWTAKNKSRVFQSFPEPRLLPLWNQVKSSSWVWCSWKDMEVVGWDGGAEGQACQRLCCGSKVTKYSKNHYKTNRNGGPTPWFALWAITNSKWLLSLLSLRSLTKSSELASALRWNSRSCDAKVAVSVSPSKGSILRFLSKTQNMRELSWIRTMTFLMMMEVHAEKEKRLRSWMTLKIWQFVKVMTWETTMKRWTINNLDVSTSALDFCGRLVSSPRMKSIRMRPTRIS